METSQSQADVEKNHPRWQSVWNAGLNPGEKFDALQPLPALTQMVEAGSIPNGRALVPGCGRGYDVILLASAERVVTGLDISPVAIAAAEEFYANVPADKKPPRESVVYSTTSFFDLPEEADSKYQFVYDYTFFCALDPSVRQQWAEKMAAVVAPGGELCTIIFPIGEKEGGPPFRVSLDDYKSVLSPVGFECVQLELLPPHLCHKGRDGVTPSDITGKPLSTGIGRWRKVD